MGRPTRHQQFNKYENFTNGKRLRNLALNNSKISITTYNNRLYWWETLSNICENSCVNVYNPTWERICPQCGSQLLPSEPKNFCCNDMLRCTILSLRPLPLTLQNLYITNPNNFSHNSRQYNSLFSFTILGYTGRVVHLPHLHAFAINGHAYHQIYPANAKGYPTNCLYRLYDVDYSQARLIIQQPTNNAEVAACTIVHSTAVIQERCVQIWRVGEENPAYINILDKNYEAL
ncbi:ATP-dependent DNA helicase pif1 [Gigaspora margarita]|uniref:ATP-dependent DNA helicase pif1 n=1 Tax=Gigaspora margarita TaxID=4874 RepID=A0A8H4AR50_GIGMA|nr:ATP-dependent DNA helicase pif1 [Gigaspora margarita]